MGFLKALTKVLKHEGGYVNNPNDRGGETYKGISRVYYPKWAGWVIIDLHDNDYLEENEELNTLVEDFYYTFYWYKLKCDLMQDEFIAEIVFNFAINMGKRQIVKKIQRILNVKADGIIGQNTLGALNASDPRAFCNHFLLEVIEFYVQISKQGNNHLFFKGWINRAMNVYYDSEHYFK